MSAPDIPLTPDPAAKSLATASGSALLPTDLLIPHYLVHSAIYYRFGSSIITDHEYDDLAKRLYNEWDSVDHRHKHLIDRDGLLSGGHYIKFPRIALNAASRLMQNAENGGAP